MIFVFWHFCDKWQRKKEQSFQPRCSLFSESAEIKMLWDFMWEYLMQWLHLQLQWRLLLSTHGIQWMPHDNVAETRDTSCGMTLKSHSWLDVFIVTCDPTPRVRVCRCMSPWTRGAVIRMKDGVGFCLVEGSEHEGSMHVALNIFCLSNTDSNDHILWMDRRVVSVSLSGKHPKRPHVLMLRTTFLRPKRLVCTERQCFVVVSIVTQGETNLYLCPHRSLPPSSHRSNLSSRRAGGNGAAWAGFGCFCLAALCWGGVRRKRTVEQSTCHLLRRKWCVRDDGCDCGTVFYAREAVA